MGRYFEKKLNEKNNEERTQSNSYFNKLIFGGLVVLGIGASVAIYQDQKGIKHVPINLESLPVHIQNAQNTNVSNQITNVSNITLEEARKNPSLRQGYIDSLVAGQNIPHCSGIIYDGDGSKIISFFDKTFENESPENRRMIGGTYSAFKGGDYDVKTPDVLNNAGKGNSIPLYVGRKIFEDPAYSYLINEDIKHVLIADDGYHCTQHAKGLPYFEPKKLLDGVENGSIRNGTLYHVFEYDAYTHGLPRAMNGEFKVSPEYLQDCKKRFIQTGHGLSGALKSASPLEQELIEKVHEQASRIPELRDVSIK